MSKFDSCLTSLDLRASVPVDVLRTIAAEYQASGEAPAAAMLHAVEDQLQLAQMEEQDIQRVVLEKYEASGGKVKEAAPTPAPTEEAAAPVLRDISKPKGVRDLVITHNLTEANLLHADKMGGIAVPSLAVTKKDSALDEFGEITLIGSRAMADPKGYAKTQVFGADIYSPRYPSVEHELDKAGQRAFEKKFRPMADRLNIGLPDTQDLERKGQEEIERNLAVVATFISEQGMEPAIVMKAPSMEPARLERLKRFGLDVYLDKTSAWDMTQDAEFVKRAAAEMIDTYRMIQDENGRGEKLAARLEADPVAQKNHARDLAYRIAADASARAKPEADRYPTQKALEQQIADAGLAEQYQQYAADQMAAMSKSERIFKGFSNSGKRTYTPHTLENVVKILKKELRGGENFNYGVGSLRAKFTPQFKSIAEIQKEKGRLVTPEQFEAVRKEIDAEFFAVGNAMRDDINMDTVIAILEDAPRMGLERAAAQFQITLSDDAKQKAVAFLDRLHHLPTAYFEAKILRDVALAEFTGAVIPRDTSQKVRDLLAKQGLQVREYDSAADRTAAIDSFAQELDEKKGDVLFDLTDQRTIEVDGQRRPIRYSNGELVAPDFEGQVKFWQVYQGEVDDRGRPVAPDEARDLSDELPPLMAGTVSPEEAPKRVATLAKLKAAQRRIENGEISAMEYQVRVEHIIADLEDRNASKVPKPRERGAEWVIERLMRARRTGELDPAAVNFALWALDKNPQLAEDMGISLRAPNERGTAGTYNSLSRVMTLFKGAENEGTAVHEILHHSERMMPPAVQAQIVKAWRKAFARAHTKADEKTRGALNDMFVMASDKQAAERVMKAFADGTLDYDAHYQLSNASEYWAVNATRIMGERFEADSWVAKAKQWLAEFVQKARGWLGLASDAPVLKGLQAVLDGTGERLSPRMLVEQANKTRDVTANQDAEQGDGETVVYDIPRWLRTMSQDTQDAARKAGLWAPQLPLKQRIKNVLAKGKSEFVQGMFDQFAPLAKLNYKAYMLARMTKSADAPLETILLYGKPFLNSAGAIDLVPEAGGLAGVLGKLNGEHDRFFAWIAGNRAAKLKTEGRENLFTDTDITALKDLNQGTMDDGSNRAQKYAQALRDFNAYSKAVMDIAEKAGIINGPSRALWESDFYVPFYRMAEDDGKARGPTNIGGMTNQYAFKKLKGGTDNLSDLMHNTLRNWSHLLAASLRNQAAASAIRAAHNMGIADPVTSSQKGSVFFLENGDAQHYVVHDPLVMDAITSLEFAGWNNPMMKAFQKAKHYLTMGVTISPEFKIANLMRDQVAAVAQTPISANIMKNLVEGWRGTDKGSVDYARMLTGGGLMRFGTFLEGDRAEHAKRLIDKGIPSAQILNTSARIKAFLPAAWDAWQEVGDRSENITRAAIYKQYQAQMITGGFSADEAHLIASFAARDSMDFSLQGKWGTVRFIAQLVPFFNARLQGLYKLGRDGIAPTGRMIAPRLFGQATTSDKRKALRFGATVMAVSLASIALMLAQWDDDDYQSLEEWQRDAYWCIKVGDKMFFIPKPFEVGAMGTLAERGVEAMMNGMDKESRALFAERMKAMVFSTFAMNPTPQLVKPMVDLYANKNSFTGRPIETPDMENRSKAERIGSRTTATAQLLGKATASAGLSPVQIDHLVSGYFGWLGTHVVMTTDFAVRPLMGLPEQADRRFPDDYIVIGRFVKDMPAQQTKYVTKFYDHAKEVQQAMGDIRYYQSMGLAEKARELRDENTGLLKLEPMYVAAQKQLGELNKEIKMTQYRKLTAEEKRERIDKLTRKKNELTKHVEELRVKRENQVEEVE